MKSSVMRIACVGLLVGTCSFVSVQYAPGACTQGCNVAGAWLFPGYGQCITFNKAQANDGSVNGDQGTLTQGTLSVEWQECPLGTCQVSCPTAMYVPHQSTGGASYGCLGMSTGTRFLRTCEDP